MEMEKETNKVKLQIVSERGHDTLMLAPTEALKRIETETQQQGKWCYIDGKFCRAGEITAQDISQANSITLTTALVGG